MKGTTFVLRQNKKIKTMDQSCHFLKTTAMIVTTTVVKNIVTFPKHHLWVNSKLEFKVLQKKVGFINAKGSTVLSMLGIPNTTNSHRKSC